MIRIVAVAVLVGTPSIAQTGQAVTSQMTVPAKTGPARHGRATRQHARIDAERTKRIKRHQAQVKAAERANPMPAH